MPDDKINMFRMIPSVDRILESLSNIEELPGYPRSLILRAINEVLDDIRKNILSENIINDLSGLNIESVTEKVLQRLKALSIPSLRNVINATGIVIHTNLGRSILADSVLKRLMDVASGYNNLEYDLDEGRRGSRHSHVEGILKELTSAEAAMVVNNNAAAVLIALDTLARGGEVIVSRGELVEIGGSFRIPDVMKKSGARMVEVGTTNKTKLKDYEEVIGPDTRLLLKVHRSNFHIIGFTEEVEMAQLSELGKRHNLPVMEDLGSGCMVDLSQYGLQKEPTVREALSEGADIVTFSGDKLLGGPQAGIIIGRKDLIDMIKKNQLGRALRIDKLTLAGLEGTLNIYRDERVALMEIPTLRMICQGYDSLKAKAARLYRLIGKLETKAFSIDQRDGMSKVGGGALPLMEMPTRLLRLIPAGMSAHMMDEWLKSCPPPIIVRVEKDSVLMDVRTIADDELKTVAQAVKNMALSRD
ncbi:MAG: L-seryl-tRNA(Sec) selenium transferase [Deltaproteobacteria bacterium]|nr:L-seryl-tRNA(Sec) selenium transferase [Deltaproteobacteria bacterium]